MEHKLDELQSQGSRLGPANLANHDQLTQLQHEILQLTAENEVSTALLYHVINAEIQPQVTWARLKEVVAELYDVNVFVAKHSIHLPGLLINTLPKQIENRSSSL